ncbi:hypothetical protein [Alicyclobacillus acidocaldarius]|uniref:Uncharacterized protein n=1 Tax=Alicyclobacillus acidocaldarius subsp. acidocaldarius (strain ATCC 27009 / DSM 446 / BCRC 14685 / JCM 5260 / KCTC 1825 / NBRC 15652 / NCIMB 11725 / NRRL B-14509 / 104-IA) TaxID=521098 RepID=C8WW02_ALIAD|nr:hypothetical protein [Alicyclobacillus acidocaldarius]ACV58274.1 hypothetical protein Aaci_1245 [Alicyclobacillus acidocaldarius subsp. acidocaldarius DSM 446]
MTQAARWLALWRFEWSRGRGVRSPWKRRLVWILAAAGVSLAAGLAISASTSASPDRVGLASLSMWLLFGSFSLARGAGAGDGLGATAMLPYSRVTVVCARAAVAYARLFGWLLLGAALSAGVNAAYGLMRNPQIRGTWFSLLAAAALAYVGLACVSAVLAALRSSAYRWLGTLGDGMWTGVIIFIGDDVAKRGPLSGTHENWMVFAAAYAAYGMVSAAVGTRCLARGTWILAAGHEVTRSRPEKMGPSRRSIHRFDTDSRAHDSNPQMAHIGADLVRTAIAIFRMRLGRVLWPSGARPAWRAALVHLSGPVIVFVALVALGWTSRHPHLLFARLEGGMLGGAWLWSMFCGFSVASLLDHLGDWTRGWPVRKEGVIVGFALAESLSTWLWLAAGALGGVALWAHLPAARVAGGADLREELLAWLVSVLVGTWNTVWSAAWTLGRGQRDMLAWLSLEMLLAWVWFAKGGRMVAWLDTAAWPKVAGVAVAFFAVAAAVLAPQLRTAARRLISP